MEIRETQKGSGNWGLRTIVSKLAVLILAIGMTESVLANPEGGAVTSGDATITQTPGNTQINQNSQQAIINWQSFNIQNGEATHFQQPTNGIALNRINPNQGASQIFGSLTATGRVVLINQAGVYFGPGSYVNVGSIIASTIDITDRNFLAGQYVFDQPSSYNGAVVNAGTIHAAENGLVALVGSGVSNTGMIEAHRGNVVLGSGNKVTVDLRGDQLINFTVDEGIQQAPRNPITGEIMQDAVCNSRCRCS